MHDMHNVHYLHNVRNAHNVHDGIGKHKKILMMKLAKRKYMMSCTGDKPAMHACLHLWNNWSAQRCHDVAGFCARFLFFPLTFPPFFQIF